LAEQALQLQLRCFSAITNLGGFKMAKKKLVKKMAKFSLPAAVD